MEAIEAVAAAAGAVYILLAIRQRRACWIAGGASSALYIAVFLDAGLPQQAALQGLYIALAIYGWFAWRSGAKPGAGPRRLQPRGWLAALAGVAAGTAVSALLFAHYGWSSAPLAESLGTWASIAATWLVARRIVDAWAWWVAVDLGLAALYASQGLAVWTIALYLAYAGLAVVAWRAWRRAMAAPA